MELLQGTEEGTPRATRADARRNRQRVFAAAKECFAGKQTSSAMEDIARLAGVGVGTLYRAYGSRAGLAEAVYRDMLDDLTGAASDPGDGGDPWEALVRWLNNFVDKLIEKQAIITELRPLFQRNPELAESSHRISADAFDKVLRRAQASHLVLAELNAADLLQLVIGASMAGNGQRERIDTLVGVILAGIRVQGTATPN